MSDSIRVEHLEVGAPVGVYEHERGVLQRLVIDVVATTDIRAAARSDALEDALDYDRISAICREVCGGRHHQLIETIAETIAAEVKAAFPEQLQAIEVRVAKPGAVPDARTVAVQVRR